MATTTPSIIHQPTTSNVSNLPAHNQTISAICHCTHSARVCQFPCSHNCETRFFFSQNIPRTPVASQTSARRPTLKLLTQVPDVCPSTDTETIDLSPSQLVSQTSVLRPMLKLLTQVPVICPSTDAETIDSHPSRLSSNRCNH